MITMEMSDDIRKYETKSIGPFTIRQVICIGIGCAYSIPLAAISGLDTANKVLLACVLAAPAIACGYVKLDGAPFEVLFFRLLYWMVLTPKKRKMRGQNIYRSELARIAKQEEAMKMSTKPQQKAYMKKKKDKLVRYSRKPENKVYR